MTRITLIAFLFTLPTLAFSQLNMTELGYVDLVTLHNSDCSDIWAHVDGNNDEFAIVGLNDGTSVVYITNPSMATEVFYEPGMNSIWRDIKTWNNHAFVTTEAQNGLLIIDLNPLNGSNAVNLPTSYYTGPTTEEWQSAHNLYIDENGICYIFGANRDNGGCIMLDVNDPNNIVELGAIENWYVHDGVARGDTLYLAHIDDGFMSIWNIADKANPVMLGTSSTPGNFSHNLWFSDDGNYVYTTDEIPDGHIGEYNISDPTNIFETDRIQSSPGMNVIPHNAHFINDYIVTSYYRDGVTVHDVSNKGNMVEVGNFDTAPTLDGDGFNGCWGAYPWLPSGNIITSDIEEGLHILGVTYTRACYLEGTVTDAVTAAPINNVTIEILGINVSDNSNIVGDYATGYHAAGTYNVAYSNAGYLPDTAYNVVLTNGMVTIQDMQLVPLVPVDVSGTISDFISASGIDGAQVVFTNDDNTYTGTSDGSGNYTINTVLPGTYTMLSGKWGYQTACGTVSIDALNTTFDLSLQVGYADDFALDLGWTISSNASAGIFERADPIGVTSGGGTLTVPEDDLTGDCLGLAYVTGNGSAQAGVDDVDDGFTQIESPSMDLTSYANPYLHFSRYWNNSGGFGGGGQDDTLRVSITNGTLDTVVVEFYQPDNNTGTWLSHNYRIRDYITLTNDVKVTFHTADNGSGHLVEAAIDGFFIADSSNVGLVENDLEVKVYPNPTQGELTVQAAKNITRIDVRDVSGKLILSNQPNTTRFRVFLPDAVGMYFLTVRTLSGETSTIKVLKQ